MGAGEIDTVVRRGIHRDVLEGYIAQRFIGSCTDEHRMTAGVVDIDIVEVNVIDGIPRRAADIERPLHRTPEITFVAACAVDTAGVLAGDIIDIECTGLIKPVSVKVGVHT